MNTQAEGGIFEEEARQTLNPTDTMILNFQLPEPWERSILFKNYPVPYVHRVKVLPQKVFVNSLNDGRFVLQKIFKHGKSF